MIITLNFPFDLKDCENSAKINAIYVQQRNIISFNIPYKLRLVTISNIEAEFIKKDLDGSFLYTIDFPKSSDCRRFIEDPILRCVEYTNEKTVFEIESEANKLMHEYEIEERRKK